jgi:hypothetical protein
MGVPFECDLCSFRNVARRDPSWGDRKDNHTLLCIRQANLDVMWSREASTVESNIRRLLLDYNMASRVLSVRHPLPALGNPTIEDRVGMGMALYTLQASLQRGRYSNHLQWDSMRKTPTWYSNAYGASLGYNAGSVMAQDQRKLFSTECPTDGKWFNRFMRGAKLRMGVTRRQQEALTANMVMAVIYVAEGDWQQTVDEEERKDIEEVVTFMLISFCGALRGEEVPLVAIEGLLKFWRETQEATTPHIMLTLRGRFKGEKELKWHCVPVAEFTRSGAVIPLRLWLTRLLKRRVTVEECKDGWLFTKKSGKARARISDYDDLFRDYLGRVQQKYPKVIPGSMNIQDFGLWRSCRRGATTEATHNLVDDMIIELINRWRKREAAKGTEAGLPMRQVYTQVSNLLDTMLQFSQGLWVRAEGGF